MLFAGIVAALAAAYTRRKLAAWRARLSAYLAAKKRAEAQAEADTTTSPPEPYQPPPGSPEAALLEGEVIDPYAAAGAKRRLKLVEQTNPQKQVRRWGAGHVLAAMNARMITLPSACTQSLLTMLLNGIGTVLVATGIGAEAGEAVLVVNGGLQLAQIARLIKKRRSVDPWCFHYLLLINILDAVPGLGVLSGLFNAIYSCVGAWALRYVHKPCDYP